MSNFKKYPNFYLLTDSTADWDKQDLHAFISKVRAELQVNNSIGDFDIPAGLELWRVYVNGRLLTHEDIALAAACKLKHYRAGSFSYFLPPLSEAARWNRDLASCEFLSDKDGTSWVVRGECMPQYKVSVCRVKQDRCRMPGCCLSESASNLKGLFIDEIPVVRFDLEHDEDDDVWMTLVAEEKVEEVIGDEASVYKYKRKKLTFPINAGNAWHDAVQQGEMKHYMPAEGCAGYTVVFGETQLVISKQEGVSVDSNLANMLWRDAIPKWQDALKELKDERDAAAREHFMALLTDMSYTMLVSGAPAVRGCKNTEGETFTIYVQDNGDVTAYEVASTLSCELCDKEGEFAFAGASPDRTQFVFRAGLKNKATGECTPVLVVFDKD